MTVGPPHENIQVHEGRLLCATLDNESSVLTLHFLQVTALHQIQKQVLRWDGVTFETVP